MRRYGEAVKSGQRYQIRPGAYAVILDGDALLTTHQMEPVPEYQLPGGGIDPGEHPLPALHREIYEETGWRVEIARKLGVYRRFTYMPEYDKWAEKVCSIYLARPVLRLGPPLEAGHTAVWMSATDGLQMLDNEGDRAMLARAMGLTV
jgi:8-oxo-dGTP diphosphatase